MGTTGQVVAPSAEAGRLLRAVGIMAVVDGVLLVALLAASVRDNDGVVSVLGPVHGLAFLASLYLTVRGAGEGWWDWWTPLLVLVTGGPLGAAIGHRRARRGWAR